MKGRRLHFMGIGGQGISALAQMALAEGAEVTGCDREASATTAALERLGVQVEIGHSSEHLNDADVLVFVPAVLALNPDEPELVAAKARRMQALTWQEMLGELMLGKCVLSVSGVHGKGTTTALLSLMLVDAGLDPTCEIGAVVPRFGANYHLGKSEYFVNEADEYFNNFWHYHPRLAVVTSIEFEHPEFFADYAEYMASFEHFVRGMDMQGNWPLAPTLILNADSPGCLELRNRLENWPGQMVMFSAEGLGGGEGAVAFEAFDVKLEGETSFWVRTTASGGFSMERAIRLRLPGRHNVQNALAALTAASCVGVKPETIIQALEGFEGIRRRFEIRHEGLLRLGNKMRDVLLVDDYAHHPTAITATLEAAHKRYAGKRLVAVYQPHMFSRTLTFFEQFLTAFDRADVTILADIFAGRERDTGRISSRDVVVAMAKLPHYSSSGKRHEVFYGGNVQQTAQLLRKVLRSGDVVLIMGAGDIYTLTNILLQGI